MSKLEFSFEESSFNKLFPFFILIDSNLIIRGIGKSLAKTCEAIKISDSFSDNFYIKRPLYEKVSFQDLIDNLNQLIVIESKTDTLLLRGQFELNNGHILFLGSPWFVSMNEVMERNLTMHDFALNDPLLDLLHVLNNQEISAQELKESLLMIQEQKNKLKRDQEELNRLSLVARANKNGVLFTNPDGKVFWCNDAFVELTGYQKEEIIGKTPIEVGQSKFTNLDELKKMASLFYKGEIFDIELIHGRKDGSFFWTRTMGQPIFDDSGAVIQYFAMIEDITLKKQADFKLIESENRLSSLIMNLQTGILLEDENKKLLLTNKKFSMIFGSDKGPEDLIGSDFSQTAENSKRFFKNPEKYSERLIEVFKNKVPVIGELLELADGRFLERSYIPVFRDGIYKGNLRTYDDVTLKRRHQENLESEQKKYHTIIANMNIGLIEVDQNGLAKLVNEGFSEMSGYNIDDLLGKNVADLMVAPESKKEFAAKLASRKKGITDSYELSIVNKSGEKRHWLISAAPTYDLNGKVIGSIGIHFDVTSQKEQEERLYLLSLIAEENINAVVVTDNLGKVEWANASFLEMTGYSIEEIIGMKPGQFLHGAETNLQTIQYMREQIKEGLPYNCEVVNYSKNGEKYWVNIHGQALYNKDNEIVKYFAVEENVTSKKLLENQRENLVKRLASSNKELEDYAQIVSHDLKSPLQSIHSLLSWIKEDNSKEFDQVTLDYLGMIENKVEKMHHLIDGILEYAKIAKIETAFEKVDIQEVVLNILKIIHIPGHITVEIKKPLPTLLADKYRIQQLFQNLISNAVNYIDKPLGLVAVDFEEESKEYVFSISDNGAGIAKENQSKIFEIFQSLTDNSTSTGLGLSIVKKIINFYDGKIWLESTVGQGTTFYFTIAKQPLINNSL